MNKKQLYKLFDGTATMQEKEAIKAWIEASPENKEQLYRDREFYDLLLLTDQRAYTTHSKESKTSIRSFWLKEIIKIAAVVAIVMSAGFYLHNGKMNKAQSAINTLYIPAGQRANLTLPDGTNVWLNARTEIKYPAIFSGSKREIELNGEAYFDVSEQNGTPFIVRTKHYDVEVKGTTFNVEAYDGMQSFSAALMTGAVNIISRNNPNQSVALKPNQKADMLDGALIVNSITDYDSYRWRDGLICFKNTNFMELIEKFEKCYGINIIVENEDLADHEFSGKFRISDGIDNALRVLQKDAKYIFVRNSDDSVIYIR